MDDRRKDVEDGDGGHDEDGTRGLPVRLIPHQTEKMLKRHARQPGETKKPMLAEVSGLVRHQHRGHRDEQADGKQTLTFSLQGKDQAVCGEQKNQGIKFK